MAEVLHQEVSLAVLVRKQAFCRVPGQPDFHNKMNIMHDSYSTFLFLSSVIFQATFFKHGQFFILTVEGNKSTNAMYLNAFHMFAIQFFKHKFKVF